MSVMDRVGNRLELLVPIILRINGVQELTITDADLDAAEEQCDGFPVVMALDAEDGAVTLRAISLAQAVQARAGYARLDTTRAT